MENNPSQEDSRNPYFHDHFTDDYRKLKNFWYETTLFFSRIGAYTDVVLNVSLNEPGYFFQFGFLKNEDEYTWHFYIKTLTGVYHDRTLRWIRIEDAAIDHQIQMIQYLPKLRDQLVYESEKTRLLLKQGITTFEQVFTEMGCTK